MQGLSSLDNSPHSPASISPIQKSLQLSQKNTVGGESGRGSKSLPSSPILHGQALPTLPIVPSSLRARAVNQDEPADDAEISVSKETDDEEEIGEDVRIAPLLMMRAEGEVPTGYLPMPLGKPSPVERLSEAFPMIPALSISQISCCPSPSTLLLGTRCFIFNRTEFERQVLRKALEKHRSDVVFDSGNTNDTVNWINHNSLSDVDIVIANAREHGCAIVSYIVNAWAERWCHESDLTTRPHQSHSTANDFPSTPDSSSLSLPTLPCFVLLLPYSTLRKSLKMIYRHLKEEVDNSQKALQRKQSDEQYCSENEGDNQATNSNERVTPRHIHPENEAACPSAESRSGNEETIYAETRGRLQEFHCQATIIEALDNAQILYTIRKPIMLSSFAAQIARSYRSAQQPIKTKQSLLHRLVQTIRNSLNSSPFPISRLVCNSEGSSSVRTSRVQSETMSAPGTPHRTNKAFINRNEVVANVAISASVNITNEQEKNATSSIISPPLKYLPPLSDSGTVSNESKLNVLDARILIVEDNMINRKLIQSILQKIGFKSRFLQFAINGLEACEKAEYDGSDNENKQFHIILMDMHMPVMDGLEATRRIISSYQSAPPSIRRPTILAMTANVMARDLQACIDAGMKDVLVKPYSVKEVQQKLFQWIKRSKESFA